MKRAILSLWLIGCGKLADVPVDVCGNLVTEGAEQCDGQLGCNDTCRFTCERGVTECPGELGCSVEGVCVASTSRFVGYDAAPRFEMPADRIVVGDLDGDLRDDIIGVGESLRVRFGSPGNPLVDALEKRIRPPTGPATIGQLDGRGGLDVVFPTEAGVFTLVSRGRELDAVPYASTAVVPDDSARSCVPSAGWKMCRTADLDRDGRADRVGFVMDRDNLELELGRSTGGPLRVTIDTADIITDVTTGDFDGDGFGDIAFASRSTIGGGGESVDVVYGAPSPNGFVTSRLVTATTVTGIAAADLDTPLDGLDDLAVARSIGGESGVAVYLGDSARDLSAPFALDGGRSRLDVPYALVAGEFVGGAGSGVDVMAYARNAQDPARTYFWWLRGIGNAQLVIGAIDPVDDAALTFLTGAWQVGDLVTDLSAMANGPDEVIGLSPRAPGCSGPALTVAVPSARFTATELLRSACLSVDGAGWQPSSIGLVGGSTPRAVYLARRGVSWWLGGVERLDDATVTKQLSGTEIDLDASCGDPQLWQQTPDAATRLSLMCGNDLVSVRQARDGQVTVTTLGTVVPGSTHIAGDFNGDGLTDLVVRRGRDLAVLLQCSTDMVGNTPGC
jgi:hypothetical protein